MKHLITVITALVLGPLAVLCATKFLGSSSITLMKSDKDS